MNRIHHIGFAVRSLKESRAAFEALGAHFFHAAHDKARNLDFQFASFDAGKEPWLGAVGGEGAIIELISPHDPSQLCAVTSMVKERPSTPYHVCIETDDLNAEIERLKKQGFKQIDGVSVSDVYGYEAAGTFLLSKGTGLVELVQERK